MSFVSSDWSITRQRVAMPSNAKVYRYQRKDTPLELDLPEIGTEASTLLGSKWADHFVLDAPGDYIQGNKRVVYYDFAPVPSDWTTYEAMGYVFPAIYPTSGLTNFAGGSQPRPRTVNAEVTYEFYHGATPKASWLTDAVEAQDTSAPFQVKSNIAEGADRAFTGTDGNSYRLGQWLVGAFITQDTIHNQINFSLQDPYSVAASISASSPTATVYDGWVTNKTKIIADRVVQRWRGNIWMRRTRRVIAQ